MSNLLSSNHWIGPQFTQNVTTKQLRTILLEGNDKIIRKGHLCVMMKKALGAGVYCIWFEKREYKG
jgi:hypothetical protein